ncbi:hypothetical protein [Methyloglobulus sp.]|uniref:hypothetical protein n=1 Tax=Methyloglobulus sp. TaxID=2518622 RepID=UPI0032B74130
MAIDLKEVVTELNDKAKELLESASELDIVLTSVFYNPIEGLESLKKHMSNLCKVMGGVIDILENENTSPLGKF